MKYLSILILIITLGFGFNMPAMANSGKATNRVKTVNKVEKININTASVDQLIKLKGIGPKKAKAIVEFRKKNGKFKKLEDLMLVKGIGKKTFEKIKPFLTL
ncbi:competence protein ComEA [Thermotomaculum hydrothermale]|uniref:Competence protein ComEA n=1 Tax=Thermotomaculum hydrothermale TaxID=981385 RepID=A0A7R6PNE0_9BACT|nr:helix-hairpin-helix domain-containing protein [Thermotomaculum hydrothermale]BBB32271.1 competence protein ComEA [Thermotomaculum hydrothermale]